MGCYLKANHNLWCHFEYKDFEFSINLDTRQVTGTHFDFKSKPNKFEGHFRANLNTEEEFATLMQFIL